MMIRRISVTFASLLLTSLIPGAALAYLAPEDVFQIPLEGPGQSERIPPIPDFDDFGISSSSIPPIPDLNFSSSSIPPIPNLNFSSSSSIPPIPDLNFSSSSVPPIPDLNLGSSSPRASSSSTGRHGAASGGPWLSDPRDPGQPLFADTVYIPVATAATPTYGIDGDKHSGAPLSDTGPTDFIAAMVLLFSSLMTLGFAFKKDQSAG